uniref:CXADR like membrane protein n=1 Tax=Leptobrachium leishanense TaxID=445787 RepID=A0A8C5PCJ5_9ANUR
MPSVLLSFLGLCFVLGASAYSEIKSIAEDNVTLPCRHQLGSLGEQSLDIEWLFNDSNQKKSVVISYSSGQVYHGENSHGRFNFASTNFLAGDATILITSLQPSDAGLYICKVKNAGQYKWNDIKLEVLVKPSEPECSIQGEKLEGKNVTLHCNSSSDTTPIYYRWQRMKYKEGLIVPMPKSARIVTPQILTIQNLSMADNGSYLCIVTNEAGKKNCTLHLTVQPNVIGVGFLAAVTCGALVGAVLLCITIWLVLRKKELKKRKEDEFLNEIREDAEAPKARLVKPGSSSSGSRSSRSGSSSTRSTTNSASRSQRTLSTQEPAPGEPRHHCLDQI